ncbi:MAG: carbon-nitrogen hydrolase family protein [Zetaproteobacteria bacterium]|nr:MAG: carbon-nitrogen hydrolase family protein [Zetaproteobacteria bacterium]
MRLAAIQLNARADRQRNLERCARLLARARQQGARLALLPENFAIMPENDTMRAAHIEDAASSRTLAFLRTQARTLGMYIIAGGLLLREGMSEKPYNRCVVIGPAGDDVAHYDKMHLFDAALEAGDYRESKLVQRGRRPVVARLPELRCGLSICYDLRFPELYRHYATRGCSLLTVSAAFTEQTGRAHWELLLRARAIENQCYVLAAAQWGAHPDGRRTWGHSMIVDPWGAVLACLPEGEGVIVADFAPAQLREVRRRLPALAHRRL